MKKELEQTINESIQKFNNCFYKILTNENGEKYIVEYSGPIYSILSLAKKRLEKISQGIFKWYNRWKSLF